MMASHVGKPSEDDCSNNEDIPQGIARQRYLTLIEGMKGRKVDLTMHENTRVSGIFETMDSEGTTFAVHALETPIGQQKAVLLRASDVISISVDLN